MNTVLDQAERLAQKRSVAAIILGTILIVTQGQRVDGGGGGPISWALTGMVVLLFLLWSSGVLRKSALRDFLNDESAELNRKRSLIIGFWNMMATAIVCYVLTFLRDFGPRDAIQIILAVGMSSSLISFGVWERIAMRS